MGLVGIAELGGGVSQAHLTLAQPVGSLVQASAPDQPRGAQPEPAGGEALQGPLPQGELFAQLPHRDH